MEIIVKALGARVTSTRFSNMAYAAENAKPVLEKVADFMMLEEVKTFEQQHGGRGERWPALSDKWYYRKWYSKFMDTRMLFMTYALFASMTERDSEHQILRITNRSVTLGSTLPYARRQNAARPFNTFSETSKIVMRGMVRDYFVAAFKA